MNVDINHRRQHIFYRILQQAARLFRKTTLAFLLVTRLYVRAARAVARFVVVEPTIIVKRQPSALVLMSRRVGLVVADGLLILVSTLVIVVLLF